MWTLLKAVLVKWAVFKVLLKTLGSFAFLIPIAFLLKFIGLPLLGVLAVLALPILFVLAIIGLPLFIVFIAGGAILALVGTVLTIGLAVLKIALPVILLVWFVNWLLNGSRKDADHCDGADPA